MIKRWVTVICGIILFSFLLSSCKSTPVRFGEEVQRSSLSNKTVFLEISMAEWQRPIFPLIDVGIYNDGLSKIADEFNLKQKSKIDSMHKDLVELYTGLYNPKIVIDSYPFGDIKYTVDFFTKKDKKTGKIDEKTSEIIAKICERHQAEYVLALIGQMQTVSVAAFGINGRNQLVFHAALLDKTGNLVSSGSVKTEIKIIFPNDVNEFISLFDQAAVLLKKMISEMGI